MRITTVLSIAVLGLSSAALAQVTRAPVETRDQNNAVAINNGVDNAATANEVVEDKVPPANMMDTPSGNSADAAPPPGEPEGATSAPPRG